MSSRSKSGNNKEGTETSSLPRSNDNNNLIENDSDSSSSSSLSPVSFDRASRCTPRVVFFFVLFNLLGLSLGFRIWICIFYSLTVLFFTSFILKAFFQTRTCWSALVRAGPNSEGVSFDEKVQMAIQSFHDEEEEACSSSRGEKLLTVSPPMDGVYHVEDKQMGIADKKSGETFRDNKTSHSTMRLTFQEEESNKNIGWFIQGTRNSNSTTFVIVRGHVFQSHKAYWEEEGRQQQHQKQHDDNHERKIIFGEFDAQNNTFRGEWLSSDGNRGTLTDCSPVTSIDVTVPLATPLD